MANVEKFDFGKRFTKARKLQFANVLEDLQSRVDFKLSSRGWCYIMEQAGYINKSQFDRVADAINDLRRQGFLPVDFVAEESARMFKGVETEYNGTPDDIIEWLSRELQNGGRYYTPDWWEGEEYYIQCIVEKIDLVGLFEPVTKKFHVPIANSKGWSSISQRAEYARRFKEAEDRGLKCVLLYCGDHDPDGLRISDTIRQNLEQISEVSWEDGTTGYDPSDLIIDRFGLNFNFIQRNGFTWIDNLITGSGSNLASPRHPNHDLPYVQNYLKSVGERKCEANAIVTLPDVARKLVRAAIEKYVGPDAEDRFKEKERRRVAEYNARMEELGLGESIRKFREQHKDRRWDNSEEEED